MTTICKQGTRHETRIERAYCDAINVTEGCSEMLFAIIQWPEIMDANATQVRQARENLRTRFGFSWAEIDRQERETRV